MQPRFRLQPARMTTGTTVQVTLDGQSQGRHYTIAKILQHKRAAQSEKRNHVGASEEERDGMESTFVAEASNEEWLVFSLLDLMVAAGANVNHRNKAGMSPLLVACRAVWSIALVEMLLASYGADLTAHTSDVRLVPAVAACMQLPVCVWSRFCAVRRHGPDCFVCMVLVCSVSPRLAVAGFATQLLGHACRPQGWTAVHIVCMWPRCIHPSEFPSELRVKPGFGSGASIDTLYSIARHPPSVGLWLMITSNTWQPILK